MQADHRGAGDRLAGAGLADHAEHFARRDVERHVVDRRERAAAGRKLDFEIADAEHGGGHRSFGFSASRSQSPSRLIDSTSSTSVERRERAKSTIRRRTGIVADPDQRAERGLRRRHADAEERKRGLGDDREREIDRGDHQHRADDIGQHVAAMMASARARRSRAPPCT